MSTKKKSAALRFLEELTGGPLTFGQLIEAIRQGEELTQPSFAKKLGISKSSLNDVEKGRKPVSPERAARFARALGYSEERFVKLALQDLLDRSQLRLRVEVSAA